MFIDKGIGHSDDYSRAHMRADTDVSPQAIHHTLGAGGNQALPGSVALDIYLVGQVILWPTGVAKTPRGFVNTGATYTVTQYPELAAAFGVSSGSFAVPAYTSPDSSLKYLIRAVPYITGRSDAASSSRGY